MEIGQVQAGETWDGPWLEQENWQEPWAQAGVGQVSQDDGFFFGDPHGRWIGAVTREGGDTSDEISGDS